MKFYYSLPAGELIIFCYSLIDICLSTAVRFLGAIFI